MNRKSASDNKKKKKDYFIGLAWKKIAGINISRAQRNVELVRHTISDAHHISNETQSGQLRSKLLSHHPNVAVRRQDSHHVLESQSRKPDSSVSGSFKVQRKIVIQFTFVRMVFGIRLADNSLNRSSLTCSIRLR
jgi:hypothetical protein